ncbi:MAG TPA: YfhO family protein [Thermoanaerobaculia bacterium]
MNTASRPRSSFIVHRSAFVVVAILAIIPFLAPLLLGEVFSLRDHFDYFQPLRWYTAAELQAGRLPLWNPYNASGEPWLANPQTGVFYPPAWLHVVLPFAAAYMLYLLFHVLLLGWGAYLFFARGASPGAALVGAVALMFSGPVLSLLDVSNNFATFAWIPLALWCAAEGAWRRGGVVLAMAFLAGEPFFAAVGAGLYVGVSSLRVVEPSSGSSTTRRLVGSALLALGLSAIQLFPFLAFVGISDRAGATDASVVLAESMPLRDWLRIAVPGGTTDQQFIPVVYVGMVVLILAGVGIVKGAPALRWLVLLAIVIFLSTGPSFLADLPLTLFRYPARLVPLGAFALVALAVAGWDRVRPNRRWADLLLAGVVLADLAPRVWPLFHSAPFRTDVVPYSREVGASTKVLRVGPVDPAKRIAWMAGYLNLYDRRFDAFSPAPAVTKAYVARHRQLLDAPTRPELARRAIGWVLTSYDLRPSFLPLARVDGVTLYGNRATLPMAALLMREPATVVPLPIRFDASRIAVTVDAAREGIVVLHQQQTPGWRVHIDGIEARSVRVDGVFHGVQITRGYHEIVWKYRAPGLFFGAMTTLFSLIALTLFLFVKHAR